MRIARLFPLAAALGVAAIGLSACQKTAPTNAASAAPVKAESPSVAVAPPAKGTTTGDTTPDVMSQDVTTLNQRGYLSDAFYDFDKSDLREDARTSLASNAGWLKRYGTMQILLEGHCDDRGTEAYNLALGERRAAAAQDYLEAMGIPAGRLKTISYGKERPFCTQDDETCWQENRRAHFVITAK